MNENQDKGLASRVENFNATSRVAITVADGPRFAPVTVEGVAKPGENCGEIYGENFMLQHQLDPAILGEVRVSIVAVPACETCNDYGWIMVPSVADPELPDQAPCPDCITPCKSFCPSCDGTCQLPGGRNFRAATRGQSQDGNATTTRGPNPETPESRGSK